MKVLLLFVCCALSLACGLLILFGPDRGDYPLYLVGIVFGIGASLYLAARGYGREGR